MVTGRAAPVASSRRQDLLPADGRAEPAFDACCTTSRAQAAERMTFAALAVTGFGTPG